MAFKLKTQFPTESQMQQSLVAWARLKKIPIIHIPNEGKRSYATARWLRDMGMYIGCADIFIARPTRSYAGFWIEMKAKGKKPTPLQEKFLQDMALEGYMVGYFDDWENAKKAIESYLEK